MRNFAPERWPAGNPETNYGNIDGSPTKTLLLEQHARGEDKYYNYAMGKRPAEELFQIKRDPDCVHNLAGNPEYAKIKAELNQKMEQALAAQKDPRILGNGAVFDNYKYTGARSKAWDNRKDPNAWKGK